MLKVNEVRALPGGRIWVKFDDDVEGEVDLSDYVGKGVFAPLRDAQFFSKVHVSAHGSIAWNDELELCPDAIYLELTGKKPEDVLSRVTAVDSDA